MILKNAEIFNCFEGLQELSSEKFPPKLAWKIQTAKTSLQPLAESLIKALNDIKTEHALRDDAGELIPGKDADGQTMPNSFQIDPKFILVINEQMDALLQVPNEVLNVSLSIADFPDSSGITANTLEKLKAIITE